MRHAVLGLLDLSPMTGYDLKKDFDESIGHFWSGDQSQIYRTLSQLVESGAARVETHEQSGRPNRNIHHITDQGRDELTEWLASEDVPQPVRNAFLARVFFAGRLDDDGLDRLLSARRTTVESKLDTLQGMADEEGTGTTRAERLRLATLRNGIIHLRAELDWLDTLEDLL